MRATMINNGILMMKMRTMMKTNMVVRKIMRILIMRVETLRMIMWMMMMMMKMMVTLS